MAGGIYNNKVIVVTSTAAAINSEIATQNALNFWFQNIAFDQAGLAVLLFSQFSNTAFANPAPQKLNELDIDQGDIDADRTAELADNYHQTGVFIDGNTPSKVWILYQQLEVPAAP